MGVVKRHLDNAEQYYRKDTYEYFPYYDNNILLLLLRYFPFPSRLYYAVLFDIWSKTSGEGCGDVGLEHIPHPH